MSRRFLTEKELEAEAMAVCEEESDPEDPFHDSEYSDENYEPSECDSEDSLSEVFEDTFLEGEASSENEGSSDGESSGVPGDENLALLDQNQAEEDTRSKEKKKINRGRKNKETNDKKKEDKRNEKDDDSIVWFNNDGSFTPRCSVFDEKNVTTSLSRDLSEVEIFLKLFPKSLFLYIAQCTNERLAIFEKTSKKKRLRCDSYEIIITLFPHNVL